MSQRILRVGIVQQVATTVVADNLARLSQNISALASQGANLIVLQELHNTPYFCQTENVCQFDLAEPIPGPSTDSFSALARQHNVVIVSSLFERRSAGLYHNTAVVFDSDGSIAGKYRKMHIPDDPAFYEKFYFTPGDMGFNPIDTSVGRLGVMVCWDQWYPEAARLMALAGAEILIYPTAIGWDMNDTPDERLRQLNAWQTVQRGHAVANGLPLVAVNRVGHEYPESLQPSDPNSGIRFWGNSFVCGPQGELLYVAPSDTPDAHIVNVDLNRSEDVRRIWPFLRDRRIDDYQHITKRFRQ